MPNTPSIVIVKEITYRGQPERYSNKYHFSGTQPADATAWKALADAIIAQERTVQDGSTAFVEAYGYNAGVKASVFQVDYTVAPNTLLHGQLGSTGQPMPGDVAVWVRWSTGARGDTGKPIYLRKYFHGVYTKSSSRDAIADDMHAPLVAYAGKMVDGSLPGGFKVCRPQGGDGSAPLVPTFATTRTLKRRGKNPH